MYDLGIFVTVEEQKVRTDNSKIQHPNFDYEYPKIKIVTSQEIITHLNLQFDEMLCFKMPCK